VQRIAFLKQMRSWTTERYGHRWRSVGRNIRTGSWVLRCTKCEVWVHDDGQVKTPYKGFGAGPRRGGGSLREWIEAALPACRSLERIVFQVMED